MERMYQLKIPQALLFMLGIARLARFYAGVLRQRRPFKKLCTHIVFVIFACSASMAAEAMAQFSDQIVIDGKTELLFTEPLQDALHANPELQKNLMSRISDDRCSASWRGYVAACEICKNVLYLVSVEVDPCSKDHKLVPLADLFPGAIGPVEATWFSGTLTIPQGKQVEYVHMGYESRYERYLFLDIEKGKAIRSTLTSGRPNRSSAK